MMVVASTVPVSPGHEIEKISTPIEDFKCYVIEASIIDRWGRRADNERPLTPFCRVVGCSSMFTKRRSSRPQIKNVEFRTLESFNESGASMFHARRLDSY